MHRIITVFLADKFIPVLRHVHEERRVILRVSTVLISSFRFLVGISVSMMLKSRLKSVAGDSFGWESF